MLIYQNKVFTFTPQFHDMDQEGNIFLTKKGFHQVFSVEHLYIGHERIKTVGIEAPVGIGQQLVPLFKTAHDCFIDKGNWLHELVPLVEEPVSSVASIVMQSRKKLFLIELSYQAVNGVMQFVMAVTETRLTETIHLDAWQDSEAYREVHRWIGTRGMNTVPAMAIMSYVFIKRGVAINHLYQHADNRSRQVPLVALEKCQQFFAFQNAGPKAGQVLC